MNILDDMPTILPVQYYGPFRSRSVLEGELKLMFAVLQDGINCYLNPAPASRAIDYKRFQEVFEWIEAKNDSGPFAYETLCHTFGLDPDALRKALKSAQIKSSQIAFGGESPNRFGAAAFRRPQFHQSRIGSRVRTRG